LPAATKVRDASDPEVEPGLSAFDEHSRENGDSPRRARAAAFDLVFDPSCIHIQPFRLALFVVRQYYMRTVP
jgi:hypothetical protein